MKCVAIVISLLFAVNLFAQDQRVSKTRYYRHEVNVSIGRIRVRSGWSDDYEHSVMNQFGLAVGRTSDGKVWYAV